MSTLKIPNSQKQIIQSNVGDYQGNLWSSFNIDLDSNPGVIKTSKRLVRALGSSLLSSEIVQAIQLHDGFFYAATNDGVYRCSVSNTTLTNVADWSAVTTLGTEDLGLETCMTSFSGRLLISLGTDIMSWTGSKDNDWWTTVAGGAALTANKVHTLEVLRTGNDTLFVTDGNVIRYYNVAAGVTSVTLDTLMTANTLTPSLDKMWVGTYTEVENNAYVYEIQVGNAAATQAYAVDGRACLTMFTYKNTPFVVTEKGYIQYFNGAGFETIAQFPWAAESKVMQGARAGLVQDSPTSLAIHPKGSKVSGKYAYIFVNCSDEFNASNNLSPRAHSGVWVLDLETFSLSHRYSITDASTDYGVAKIQRSGPLLLTGVNETRIMVGSEVNNQDGVWMEDTATAQGYFVAVRHESETIADAFESAIIKNDTLASGEAITVKYKDVALSGFPKRVDDVNWLSATEFTTLDALTDVQAGHEVEILAGHRAGELCHIVSINGGTTKTVTIDSAIGAVGQASDIQIDSWAKIPTPITSTTGEYKRLGATATSASRQYKVVMKGDVTVREFTSKSNSKVEM